MSRRVVSENKRGSGTVSLVEDSKVVSDKYGNTLKVTRHNKTDKTVHL